MLGGCTMPQGRSGYIRHVAPGIARSRAFRFYRVLSVLRASRASSSTLAKHAMITLRPDASGARRPAGQHIVDQYDIGIRDHARARGAQRDRPAQRTGPCLLSQSAQRRSRPSADKGVDAQRAMTELVQLAAKQGGLVEAALPDPPAVQRHRYDHPVAHCRREARRDQPREQWGQRDPASWSGGVARQTAQDDPSPGPVLANGRWQDTQQGSDGIDRSSQQAAHKPPCSPTPPPHAGQRGG